MNYRIIQPPAALKPFVRYFWMLEDKSNEAPNSVFHSLVDDSSGIIFQQHEGESAFYDHRGNMLKTAFFYGQSTRPTTTFTKKAYELIGVNFQPHAIKSLFDIDAHLLTDQKDDFGLLKEKGFYKRLENCNSQQQRLFLLLDWLQQKAQNPGKPDALVCQWLHLINRSKGKIHISELLKIEAISERQMERRFKAIVGIPPKLYIRIIRFREALRLIKGKQYAKLSDIAFHLNYADQAHFIRDIREFSGYTPKSLSDDVSELVLNLHVETT